MTEDVSRDIKAREQADVGPLSVNAKSLLKLSNDPITMVKMRVTNMEQYLVLN